MVGKDVEIVAMFGRCGARSGRAGRIARSTESSDRNACGLAGPEGVGGNIVVEIVDVDGGSTQHRGRGRPRA